MFLIYHTQVNSKPKCTYIYGKRYNELVQEDMECTLKLFCFPTGSLEKGFFSFEWLTETELVLKHSGFIHSVRLTVLYG